MPVTAAIGRPDSLAPPASHLGARCFVFLELDTSRPCSHAPFTENGQAILAFVLCTNVPGTLSVGGTCVRPPVVSREVATDGHDCNISFFDRPPNHLATLLSPPPLARAVALDHLSSHILAPITVTANEHRRSSVEAESLIGNINSTKAAFSGPQRPAQNSDCELDFSPRISGQQLSQINTSVSLVHNEYVSYLGSDTKSWLAIPKEDQEGVVLYLGAIGDPELVYGFQHPRMRVMSPCIQFSHLPAGSRQLLVLNA
ncbi:hypothetical protein B0H14DRAFT_2562088 [Mycena olivaceomarginata]|nr:hypothetical protein B0H14DRAFT_2562088 [Mycena olivaceomarginata]